VPEEAIPDLYQSTSVLVMPYDSATGSSGPAHQACEYGVPIVCADIPDLREMAADEDMAVSFYGTGDAEDLAEQLITILNSSELQRRMAEHNYNAGVRMTMSFVIRNYLRWFELHRRKKAIRNGEAFAAVDPVAVQITPSHTDSIPPDRPSGSFQNGEDKEDLRGQVELTAEGDCIAELGNASIWDSPHGARNGAMVDCYPSEPTFEGEC
jgi:hypothetical protein